MKIKLCFRTLLQHDGKNWTLDLQIRSSRCFIPLDNHDSFSKSTQYRQYSKYRFKIWFKWKLLLTNESKKLNWDKLSWSTQVLSKITKVHSLKRKRNIYFFHITSSHFSCSGTWSSSTWNLFNFSESLQVINCKAENKTWWVFACGKKRGKWTYLCTSWRLPLVLKINNDRSKMTK